MGFEALDKPKRYPGRSRVMTRDSARDAIWRREVVELGKDKYVCLDPVPIYAIGLPSVIEPGARPLPLELAGRCRKCDHCLSHRRRLWTARAVDEIAAARRTWFGTLTVRPEDRFRYDMLAEAKHLRAGGETLSSLTGPELFELRCRVIGRDITKFLKRVRETCSGPLRYLLVAESHKDGFPHFHCLVHEISEPITKRVLENQWRNGFSNWRLVGDDERAAVYVCKYLSKDALTRVRASQHYGQSGAIRTLTERILKMGDALENFTKKL